MNGFKLYDWMPFFAAVRDKLLVIGELPTDERDRQMSELAESLYVELGRNPPILNEIYWPVNPFTFIYSLASRHASKTLSKQDFYAWVVAQMELSASAPTDRIFPTPQPDVVIAGYSGTNEPLDSAGVNETWRIFKIVATATQVDDLSKTDYDKFQDIKGIALGIATQSMFLIKPEIYLPLDSSGALGLLHRDLPHEFGSAKTVQKNIRKNISTLNDTLKLIFARFPEAKPYEINFFGYAMLQKSDAKRHAKFKKDPNYDIYCAEVERIAKLIGWQDNAATPAAPTAHTGATVAQTKAPLNRIFYGPPGTGKTYHTVNAAVEICDPDFYQENKDRDELLDRFDQLRSDKQVEFVTFHQSFDYEYFVEGLKAETTDDGGIRYEVGEGIFKRLCERAQHKEGVPHVLIIDEINRGNLSKIFGELITLLEESKRIGNKEALRATLPYSNKSFGVPANLYLIGTMNTADRSIALLDTALRRRFEFVEMMPDSSLLRDVVIDDINVATMVDAINARIAAIYDRDHQIGHAYFMSSSAAPSVAELADVFRHKVLPLLQEYFYDDWEKIDVVLNHNKFVVADDMPPMPDNDWIDANKKLWRFDYTALYNRDKYRRIYESRADDSATDE